MKIIIIILVLFATSLFAKTPNFIADCTTNTSHFYWDGLNLNGDRNDTMYDENVKPKFQFDYVGGEYIYIDNDKKGLIVKELEDIIIFIELTSNMNAATLISYSINFKSGDGIITHNNNSVIGESTQTKVGLLKLTCNVIQR